MRILSSLYVLGICLSPNLYGCSGNMDSKERDVNEGSGATTSAGGSSSAGSTSTGGVAGTMSSGGSVAAGGSTAEGGTGPIEPPPPGVGTAADLVKKLGRTNTTLMIGMGNDISGGNDHTQDTIYTLNQPFDLHYAYLAGLPGSNGWPDWNENGSYVDNLSEPAIQRGIVPMFTLYQMAAWGDGNFWGILDDGFMGQYWEGYELLMERLAGLDVPAVVHLEPDFWGYVQQNTGSNAEGLEVKVTGHSSHCSDLPNNLAGMGHCMIAIARAVAPKVAIGFSVSAWGGELADTITFFNAVGAGDTDFITLETLDRDAGCFEDGTLGHCQRDGEFYWDMSNQSTPSFQEHLAWAKSISEGVGKPIIWWQTPFGVPSDNPGGTPGAYRDNRVTYMFAHPDEFVEAGGAGIVFGCGAGEQTFVNSDGGQFVNAVTAYYQNPAYLP